MSNGTTTDFFNPVAKGEVQQQGITIETLRGILALTEETKNIAAASLDRLEHLVKLGQIVSDHLRAERNRLAGEIPPGLTRAVGGEDSEEHGEVPQVVPKADRVSATDVGQALARPTDARGGI